MNHQTTTPSEGVKHDGGKARIELVPPELVFAVAQILTFGAAKYTTKVENEWDRVLHVQNVKELQVVTPRGDVVGVTRNTSGSPIPSLQNANVKIGGIGKPETRIESKSWQSVGKLIQELVHGTSGQNGSASSQSTDSPRTSTPRCALRDAPSAGRPSTCILTIVTDQGCLEVSFAPDATTDSVFWTTVWKGLKEHFSISEPQSRAGDRNWELGMSWGRVFGALMRHLWAWWGGRGPTTKSFLFGDLDSETGMSHLWHAACCIAFLVAYEERGAGTDDRLGTGATTK
jgi:hypothetical protein